MMRLFLLSLFLIVSCQVSSTQTYDDEVMYDLASKLKDISQKVDGYVKFSPEASNDNSNVLEKSGVKAMIKQEFSGYQVKVDVQGVNIVLLLCKDDVALIEDAGCNSELDKALWKTPKANSCRIVLDSTSVCRL